MAKIYYYSHKDTLSIDNNADDLNNCSLFPPLYEYDGKNGYDYSDSSTKDSNVDDDVGLGDYLDDSDKCSNTESDDKSKDVTLSRKSCTHSSSDAVS